MTFEKAFKELSEITEAFEREAVSLDEGLAKFERGLELIKFCRQKLSEVENKVKVIKAKFEAGEERKEEPPEELFTDTNG
ncbi:MAG: exodeoxyribonuclease VII small subunit [Parcubacteria group bacterium]|nr:exodeoxyribonuclease VII small subunit [Parcubacteria group bacterium]